jgi:hypothetical protein
MTHARRFAPISSDRSNRLELVAAYFALNGILAFGVLLLAYARALFSRTSDVRTLLAADPSGAALGAVMGCVYFVVAWQLFQRRRGAGITAVVLLALPLMVWALGARVDGATIVVSSAGLLLIRSAWGELEPDSRWPRRPKRAG